MILGIDAFNISSGGGLIHLINFLNFANPKNYGFEKVVIWAGESTLSQITDKNWLVKVSQPYLNKNLWWRGIWHLFIQKKQAKKFFCDIIFCPGGISLSGFSPAIVMSQNMLPFEWREIKAYGFSFQVLKFLLLRFLQKRSFKSAAGIIFLTRYARDHIMRLMDHGDFSTIIIPHGISSDFFRYKKPNSLVFSDKRPCRLLYVSIISPYKHHVSVVKAVSLLRSEGFFVTLDLVGPPDVGLGDLNKILSKVDPLGKFIKYRGSLPHKLLIQEYKTADVGIFASSCENMPIILLECMASGLPMASSNMGPMPEILGDAGEYFNPRSPTEIYNALKRLISSPQLRGMYSSSAYQKSSSFSWSINADETLKYLASAYRRDNF